MEAHYESYSVRILNELKGQIRLANRMLIEDIHRESRMKTPLSKGLPSDGDLREQVTKRVEGNDGIITWTVPYASYQERGSRYDGSRVVRRYTTPGTGSKFAENAVKKALEPQNLKKYIKFGLEYRP